MSFYISRSESALTLVFQNSRLDFSLKRHHYPSLKGAQAKLQNSILYSVVTIPHLEAELRSLGDILEQRMEAPNLVNQAAGVGRARLLGKSIKAAVAAANLAQLHDDYRLHTGRTWRVDSVSLNPLITPNHCYPIDGPNLWSQVSQTEFAAAAALRKLEKEMDGVRDLLSKKWQSMQHMSAADQKANALFNAISGARTHMRSDNLSGPARNMLGLVSGRADLLKELAKIQ